MGDAGRAAAADGPRGVRGGAGEALTRRGAVALRATVAALLVSVAASCAGSAADPAPIAADFGPRFPPLPPDVRAVAAVSEPQAAVAVLHVPQIHYPAGLADDLSASRPADAAARDALRERIARANESQRAVHAVLRSLAASGWDRVFAEGVASEFPQTDRLSLATEYLGALRRIDDALGTPPPTFGDRFVAHGFEGPPDDATWADVRYVPGAEVLLALTGEIRLLPAERRDLHRSASVAFRDGGVAAASAWSEAREDAILAEVAAAGDGPAVVLLGAAHDLSDNVARWNLANPGLRIALGVVTPR